MLCWAVCLAWGLPPDEANATIVRFNTSLGQVDVRLVESLTPASTANFLNYVTTDRYAGTFIHRVPQTLGPGPVIFESTSADFVVQGGGFKMNSSIVAATGIETDAPIGDEFNLSNTRGTLAFAKNQLGATSQWFFNLDDNSFLDQSGFTVFGRVVGDGMQVVDAINNLEVANAQGAQNGPGEDFDEIPVFDADKVLQQQNIFSEDAVMISSIDVLPLPAGDYDFDGDVDADDYSVWKSTFGSMENIAADGNGNGIVDLADYTVWRNHLGATSAAAFGAETAPVPEPATGCLTAGAILSLWLARKKSGPRTSRALAGR